MSYKLTSITFGLKLQFKNHCFEYNFTAMSLVEYLQSAKLCAKKFMEVVSFHNHNYVSGHYLIMAALKHKVAVPICK